MRDRQDKMVDEKSVEEKVDANDRFLTRVKFLLGDCVVLSIGLILLCITVVGIVHLFRLLHTGKYLISAITSCSSVLSAFAWPSLVVALVILYRSVVVKALKEVPDAIRNFSLKDAIQPGNSDARKSDVAVATLSDNSPSKGVTSGPISSSRKKGNSGLCNASVDFEDYVLSLIQREYGVLVNREVYLFSNRSYCFDGAMICMDRVLGIEVCYGGNEQYSRQLSRIEQFYQQLSSRERRHVGLIYCVHGETEERISLLDSLRETVSFPVEFRVFQYGEQSREEVRIP